MKQAETSLMPYLAEHRCMRCNVMNRNITVLLMPSTKCTALLVHRIVALHHSCLLPPLLIHRQKASVRRWELTRETSYTAEGANMYIYILYIPRGFSWCVYMQLFKVSNYLSLIEQRAGSSKCTAIQPCFMMFSRRKSIY